MSTKVLPPVDFFIAYGPKGEETYKGLRRRMGHRLHFMKKHEEGTRVRFSSCLWFA